MENAGESDRSEEASDLGSTNTVLSARRIEDFDTDLNLAAKPLKFDTSLEDTVSAFNKQFERFLKTKSELILDELNRCLVLLGTTPNISQFEPENVQISMLFVNVYKLLSTIESRSALLWSALSFIEQAAQNCSARIAIVQKFKYMETLGKLLGTLSNPDRIQRVLKLMECLTYGIRITWQEPYLKDMIKALVNFITGENEILIAPALSILINLCYKNLPPVYLLLRCIKTEEFLTKIESYGILACKMSLLLENNLDGVTENEILGFVKFTFAEIHRALRSFNMGLLRHTVEFFVDMKENRAICMHFESYDNYPADVHCILQYIIAVDNSPDYDVDVIKEAKRGWSQCISLLFEFLTNIINLKADVLRDLFPEIACCSLKWIMSPKAGTRSLELLTTLISNDDNFRHLKSVYDELASNVCNTLSVLKTIDPTTAQITALLKLLSALLKEKLLSCNFSNAIKAFFFESIFGDLFDRYNEKEKCIPILPQPEVSMYIFALAILADLADWDSDNAWKVGIDRLLKSSIIQFIIAKATLCDDAETCSLVFRLAQLESFPVQGTSEKMVKEGRILMARSDSVNYLQEGPCPADSLPNNLLTFNTENRINELIDRLSGVLKSNQINNILMSDVMELFEFKINMCTNEEKDLLSRLDVCNTQVTGLSQKLTLLSAEVSRYQSQNLTLQMNIDRLQESLENKIDGNNNLKQTLQNYEMALNNENSHQAELISQIELKDAEIRALGNQLAEARNKLKEREDELQRLQKLITFERRQNNDLELCVKNLEILSSELQMKIAQQEQSIRDNREEIMLLEKKNSSLEDQAKKAEDDLMVKTNILEQYSQELKDVEEMRNRVVSIMKKRNIPP